MSQVQSPHAMMMREPNPRSDDTPTPVARLRMAPLMAAGIRTPVDRVYGEFCARCDAGEALDPDEFCARHPSMRSSLQRLVQAHVYLEQNASLLDPLLEIQWPSAGDFFLGYRLLLKLGQGAFARVFLAAEPRLGDRLVALKISMEGRAEAEVLGRIRHPNIVPVYSVQTDERTGLTAVCMPYLGSATLCDVLDKAFTAPRSKRGAILDAIRNITHPLDTKAQAPPDRVLRDGVYLDGIRLIGAQLAEALAFIHERGICHRDLKPSNVLLTPEGVPMLLDFNLCAEAERALPPLGGTVPFMSPEQLRAMYRTSDETSLDSRSDMFSLGVILYELATGTHPFVPEPLKLSTLELHRLLLKRQKDGPMEAKRINPDVDSALSWLIQRCLAFDPHDRPQDASEIAQALRKQLQPPARMRRWMRRRPVTILTAVLLTLTAAMGGGAFTATRPPLHERQYEAGLKHAAKGQYREALPYFNEALRADPTNSTALRARAHAYVELGAVDATNYDLALQDYSAADEQAPNGRNKAGQGYCWNRAPKGKTENAIICYEDAIKAGFATAEVYNNLGYCYIRAERFEDAKKALDRALELDPNSKAANHNRAMLVYTQTVKVAPSLTPAAKDQETYHVLKSGIEDAQKAIAQGSASAELHFNAACLCALAMRVEPALWKPSAVQYATEATRQGYPTKTKLTDPVLRRLRENETLRKAIDNAPVPQSLPPTERLVDPNNKRTADY